MIRQADIREFNTANQIHGLQQAAYRLESQLIDYPHLPPLHETVEDLQHSAEQFVVFEEAGQILGAVSYEQADDKLDICRLVVSPSHFRRGIAARLLEAVEFMEPAIRQVTVSTAEKNIPAVTLYQKQGYQVTQRTVLDDGLVLVQLQKQVNP